MEKSEETKKIEKLSEEDNIEEEVFHLPAGKITNGKPVGPSPPLEGNSGLQVDKISNPTENDAFSAGAIGETQVPQNLKESPKAVVKELFHSLEEKVVNTSTLKLLISQFYQN